MDRADYPHWGQHELRESPLILWGRGEFAQRTVRLFAETLEAHGRVPELFRLFEPDKAPMQELQALLAQLADSARDRGKPQEFELELFIAAWQVEESDFVELLENISQTLQSTVPGNPSLTLAMLLPPPTASDEEKQQVYRCFLALEDLLGTLSLLNVVFVYQMPVALYQQPLETGTHTPDFLELLFRVFVDAGLAKVVHSLGHHVINGQLTVRGRKAGYSALGAQRLLYLKDELRRHLKARFQYELFCKALSDLQNVSEHERDKLEKRAQAYAESCQKKLAEQFSSFQRTGVNLPANPVRSEEDIKTARAVFEDEVGVAERQLRVWLAPLMDALERVLQEDFDAVLAENPAYLAGARVYLTAVATELDALRETFGKKPFAEQVTEYCRDHVAKLPARFRSYIESAQDPLAAVRAAEQVFGETDADTYPFIPLSFLASSWAAIEAYLDRPSSTQAEARQLLDQILTAFFKASQRLGAMLEQNQRRHEALKEAMAALYRRYWWFLWWFFGRRAFLEERKRIQAQLVAVVEEQQGIQQSYALIRAFCSGLANEIIWPLVIRMGMVDQLHNHRRQLTEAFTRFCQTVETDCADRWQDAEPINEVDRLTATTIGTRTKLDLLYQRMVGSTRWLEYADLAMAHLSDTAIQGNDVDYQSCKTLREHFHGSPELLLERLSHFADERVASQEALDALDLIEVEGVKSAQDFLARITAKTESLPAFASGRVPLVEQHGLPKRVRVVRCTPQIQEKLKGSDYGYLLGNDVQFQDTADPTVIDLTTFTFGFPAFLLHPLADARKAATEEQETPGADLWPQPEN